MVFKLAVGPMACNCYVVSFDPSKHSVIIDPGADPERIKSALNKNYLTAKYIINTHGHGDHIGANAAFGLPVLIHRLDEDFLYDPSKNLSEAFMLRIRSPKASRLLEDGDRIEFGGCEMSVIHTPGHTPGGISLKMGNSLFTGDTLFAGGIGRTDLPDGDENRLMRSIKEKLLVFDDNTVIYPGHGPDSTIGDEKNGNPFL